MADKLALAKRRAVSKMTLARRRLPWRGPVSPLLPAALGGELLQLSLL